MNKKFIVFLSSRKSWTLPYIIFSAIFVIIPLFLIVVYAFTDDSGHLGSVVILGGLSLVNSLHAYTFASLKRKKLISTTPLNDALNALILALNASAAAFVLLFTKKFKILS